MEGGVEKILSHYRFTDFLKHVANIQLRSALAAVVSARACVFEGKERRGERNDATGTFLVEMEGTDAPGTVISPGEENGERDP